MTENNIAIETNNLSKIYGKVEALLNLNIRIKEGELYGLLGPNGAGKTTTVRLLNCIIKPTSGYANVGVYSIFKEPNKVKKITGYLPESPALYQKLTALEYLEYVGKLYNLSKNVIESRINELLTLFELSDRKYDLIEEYSLGMKQKVCLSAALIQDPEIIFLDEPTSGLDPAASRMVKDLILKLVEEADKTIFLCTHLLDIAEELCDRIGIINRGQIKTEGEVKDIIEQNNVDSLESAYLKVLGIKKLSDLLSWR
ncbi:MAG: ABC transporter ATP-binding protein [Promethearchaeota archaeon]|nr:MAG: ABC transporter ATP-binding protein [Candidatus Lokiarchaeota archaeon]